MITKKRNRFQRFSNTRYLTGLMALALLASTAGCVSPQANQNNQNQNQTPTASPTASPITAQPLDVDTPIIINGGTIDIELANPGTWTPDPTVPGKFTCTGCRITGPVTVEPGEHLGACHAGSPSPAPSTSPSPSASPSPTTSPLPCPTPSPYPQGATIVIDGGGAKKNITVTSTATDVVITFDPGEYPANTAHLGHFSNCNDTSKVKNVTINGQNCAAVPANGKCRIAIPITKLGASPSPTASPTTSPSP